MAWTTLHLKVLTPLFSGDDPKGPPSIRVPSIRGALRFWLRAVIAGRGLVRNEKKDLRALWEAEESVLGSTTKPSQIGLRIGRRRPEVSDERTPEWTQHSKYPDFDGAQYLLGQGLWKPGRNGKLIGSHHVPAGAEFDLDVRFSGKAAPDHRFMVALWAWLTYGGLGARTRRGFGQLGFIRVSGVPLPADWSADDLARPSTWADWGDLSQSIYPPAARWSEPDQWTGLSGVTSPTVAEHPALDHRWWAGCAVPLSPTQRTLGGALHQSGLAWRLFRAGPNATTDHKGLPFKGTRSPEWTEVIRGTGSVYPVGALGLPVNYFSQNCETEDFNATVSPEGDLRRASPVWLRPVQIDDGSWELFTFFFDSRLLPAGTSLRLTRNYGKGRTTLLKTFNLPSQYDAHKAWSAWLNYDPAYPEDGRLPSRTQLLWP